MVHGYMEPLYPTLDDLPAVLEAIGEVISQDPRAIHDGRCGSTDGGYGVTFSALRVFFEVKPGSTSAVIIDAQLDPGDATAPVGTYQNSLARRRQEESEAALEGRAIKWRYPLREGVLHEAFERRR